MYAKIFKNGVNEESLNSACEYAISKVKRSIRFKRFLDEMVELSERFIERNLDFWEEINKEQ